MKNHDKINARKKIYSTKRYKTDIKFRLIRKTRSPIYKALKRLSKYSATKQNLGIAIDTYRRWIEYQIIPDMTWISIEIDHKKPICMFDVSKFEELSECFSWKNTQHLFKKIHTQKGIKHKFLNYQLQLIKAYQFIKLNEEGFNKDFHQ